MSDYGGCARTTHAEAPSGGAEDCPICGRRRCLGDQGEQSGEGRCRKFPIKGGTVCTYHGGATRHQRSAAMKNLVEQEVRKAGIFWHGDKPVIADINQALLKLTSDLFHTHEALKVRLDSRIEEYEHWRENPEHNAYCICCGQTAGLIDPLDDTSARMWQFVVRELSTMLKNVAALGLAERALQIEEAKALMFVEALEVVTRRLDLDDETTNRLRVEVPREVLAIEQRSLQSGELL